MNMRIIRIAYLLLLLLVASLPAAQDRISVESKVDKPEITIGDIVRYTVVITADTSLKVDSLEVGSSLGMFEIKDYVPREEKVREGFRVITESFEITTFTTGDYQIPSLTITYRTTDDQVKTIDTDPIAIKVKSLLTGEDAEDIKPLKAQKAFEPGFPYLLVIIGAIILLAVAIFIYIYRRARKPIELLTEEIDTRLPWEIALQELGELNDAELIAKGEYKLFYLKLSEIFRRYLEKRYGIKALERTTWEIIAEFRQLGLPAEEEKIIAAFLDDCDLVKFAKFLPTADQAESDFQRAREFVLNTRSLPYVSNQTKT
jgi:hypothetical protein